MVPTMARTMLYRKPSAQTATFISSPSFSARHQYIVRTVVGRRRRLHTPYVQRRGVEAHALLQEGVADARVHYPVDVLFFYAAQYGVEVIRGLCGAEHGDVVRQTRVHRERDSLHGYAAVGAEIGAVVERVYARVRAPAAGDLHRVAADL